MSSLLRTEIIASIRSENLTYEQLLDRCADLMIAARAGADLGALTLRIIEEAETAAKLMSAGAQYDNVLTKAVAASASTGMFREVIQSARALEDSMRPWRNKQESQAAGKAGGRKRSLRTDALKQWALQTIATENLKGSDIQIANGLVERLPPEHLDASRDPRRLILDAIKFARKTRQNQ